MRRVEFVIPNRPLSLQAADRANYQEYKRYVGVLANMAWGSAPIEEGEVNVSIVFLCDNRAAIDVDNIIKPIQDAMNDIIYSDDVSVTDCDSHRRYVKEGIDLTDLPPVLIEMIVANEEAVYVRVRTTPALAEHL